MGLSDTIDKDNSSSHSNRMDTASPVDPRLAVSVFRPQGKRWQAAERGRH